LTDFFRCGKKERRIIMLRSLYTGISGLRNHQVLMDVTSHNIANVSTEAYKAQRVTLKEGFSQMLRGATRPAGNAGGTNPMQIGLGMSIGSIDTVIDQGSLKSTGQFTDLAIEGRAYFAFSNGMGGTYYGRNGNLQLNSEGYLVAAVNGFSLLGLTADSTGNIPHTAIAAPIKIPFGEKDPARATENIQFACNLDADGNGRGTWIHTAPFLTNGIATDKLTGLYDGSGNSLNIQEHDMIRIEFKDSTGQERFREFKVIEDTDTPANTTNRLSYLASEIESVLNANGNASTVNVVNGRLVITGTVTATNLVVKNVTRPTSNSYVANAFQWPGAINTTPPFNESIGKALAAATPDTLLSDVYDAHGQLLGLENGDPIKVHGTIGSMNLTEDLTTPSGALIYGTDPLTGLPYAPPHPAGTTMKDLMDYIQMRLRLPDSVSSPSGQNVPSIEINTIDDGDTRAPVGSIVIRGQMGTNFAISGLKISAENSNNNQVNPSFFNANIGGTEFQTAREVTIRATSIEVFDESGAPHTVTMTFTHSGTPGKWLWELTTQDGELIDGGNRGYVTFSEDGSPDAWIFDDPERSTFRFDPMNGSAMLDIRLDVGHSGIFTGITQFRSANTTAAKFQDGYTMGKLSEITITEQGEINGLFSNGTGRMLAIILLAEFTNPAGLLRHGDSMWGTSNNSGEGVLHHPGEGTPSTIKPGALEMSNVDLASEFTDLITTQRGYQANARVISTSDTLLQELVQLVR
jgi:flagellar hook protein FlgE